MKSYSSRILLLMTGAVLATISLPARHQLRPLLPGTSVRDELRKILPKHSALPPVGRFDESTVPQDPQDQERRVKRDRLKGLNNYNLIVDPGVRDINGQAEAIGLTFIDEVRIVKPGERADPIGLPISDSFIVIGTVTSANAYVNQLHTRLFSEYKVAVQEVLKADPDNVISAQDEISVWRSGGSLQFPSGYIKHFIIAGRGFPEVATQYVLFLRRPDKTVRDYPISSAYSLKDQVVVPLDDEGKTGLDGMPVKDFLSKLREEIRVRQEGGND